MKIINKFSFLLPVILLAMVSCTDYDKKGWQMTEEELTDTELISFTLKSTYDGRSYQYQSIIRNDSIIIRVPYSFDFRVLDSATAEVSLNNMCTISPLPEYERNYNDAPVTFTVTAPDKVTEKVYTFGWEPHGFGDAYEYWYKSWEDLGLSTADPTSAAVCGDYVVIARAHTVYDRFTGEQMPFSLNITGVPGVIFWLTNDDAGNMVGCTLPATSDGEWYNIYTWTSVEDAPVLIWSQNITQGGVNAGRKLDVKGDINGTAYLSGWITGNDYPTIYHRIKVENGVVTELPDVNTVRRRRNGYPAFALEEASEESRFYVFTHYGEYETTPSITFGSVDDGSTAEWLLAGPLSGSSVDYWYGYYGWGNLTRQNCGVFAVNGIDYMFSINGYTLEAGGTARYFLNVIPVEDIKAQWTVNTASSSYFVPEILLEGNVSNVNGTVSVTVIDDGAKAYVYVLATTAGLTCHILENVWE